jgi:hypothetical protein
VYFAWLFGSLVNGEEEEEEEEEEVVETDVRWWKIEDTFIVAAYSMANL